MKEPDVRIGDGNHTRDYENLNHLESGKATPMAKPLKNPKVHLAALATLVTEAISGVRSVDQLALELNDHAYESLKRRIAGRAQLRLASGKRPVIYPTRVVNVRYQSPAEGVIESVVILSNRNRCRAVAIRLEGFHEKWLATNIGFL